MNASEQELKAMIAKMNAAEAEIGKAIIGQKDVIRQVLLSLVAGGNVLLEGVPGLGKTQLVKALSQVCDLEFSRIQFTPDLMPADVTGTDIIVKKEGRNEFEFQAGPVFANLLLADEINRATPKTQSALLEAMQEHTVTVGNNTYPLPEAQLDRFLFKIQVDFPTFAELKKIMAITVTNNQVELNPVLSGDDIMNIRQYVNEIPMAEEVEAFALRLVIGTHPEVPGANEIAKQYISCGASPRAAQAIFRTSRAKAMLEGRYNVSFEDVEAVALPALRHRVTLSFEALAEGITTDQIVKKIISSIPKE